MRSYNPYRKLSGFDPDPGEDPVKASRSNGRRPEKRYDGISRLRGATGLSDTFIPITDKLKRKHQSEGGTLVLSAR